MTETTESDSSDRFIYLSGYSAAELGSCVTTSYMGRHHKLISTDLQPCGLLIILSSS